MLTVFLTKQGYFVLAKLTPWSTTHSQSNKQTQKRLHTLVGSIYFITHVHCMFMMLIKFQVLRNKRIFKGVSFK